ncbi:MAG: hypothetical protein JRC87_01110 [Deltaproteobacteria bacterium]|nr:hypothetical protein [Deltaproteobacteria bacterium]
MEQHTENQYDDDLTVEAGEYDEYYPTDAVDLFEFSAQEESPLSKLKSLILSIDWEITDEILIQFNDELVALKEIWAAEKYNLVYIQALEKISKYIYQQKANAHPDAIKLLLTFYYNLEQVVSSGDLTESQKKDILLKDVSRFQYLKRQIANQGQDDHMFHDEGKSPKMAADPTGGDDLRKLKSIVLGIDWEITDQDLNELRREVINLEEEYADSRPRLILLQGIGILGAYIKSKKSDAHADAFILLHYFFESLEKMARSPLSLEGEKEILFPAVEKFNTFKAIVGSTITSEPVGTEEGRDDSISPSVTGKGIQPAFADIPEDSVAGFQEDEEVKNLEGEESIKVADHIDSFFGENDGGTVLQEEEIGTDTAAATGEVDTVDSTLALEGADVSYDGEIEKGTSDDETEPMAVDAESLEMESPASSVPEPEIELVEPVDRDSDSAVSIDRELALQGVEVETEADDDSDEEALPIEESGKLAPALKDAGNLSESGADSFVDPQTEDSLSEEIAATLDGFFVDDQHMEEGVAGDGSVAAEQQEAEKKEEITTEIKAVEEKAPADEEVVFELLSSDSGHGDEVDEQVKEIVAVEGEEPDIVEMPEEIVAVEEMEEDVTEIAEEIVAVEEEDEDITEIPEEAFAIDEQEEDTAELKNLRKKSLKYRKMPLLL